MRIITVVAYVIKNGAYYYLSEGEEEANSPNQVKASLHCIVNGLVAGVAAALRNRGVVVAAVGFRYALGTARHLFLFVHYL